MFDLQIPPSTKGAAMHYTGPALAASHKENLVELAAQLERMLELAKELELEPRSEIYEAHHVLLGETMKFGDAQEVYRYPLGALTPTGRVRLAVYRREGTPYGEPRYAIIDDIDDAYEPTTIETIVKVMQHPELISQLPIFIDHLKVMIKMVSETRRRTT